MNSQPADAQSQRAPSLADRAIPATAASAASANAPLPPPVAAAAAPLMNFVVGQDIPAIRKILLALQNRLENVPQPPATDEAESWMSEVRELLVSVLSPCHAALL